MTIHDWQDPGNARICRGEVSLPSAPGAETGAWGWNCRYRKVRVGRFVEVPNPTTGVLETVFKMTGLLAYTAGGSATMLDMGRAMQALFD
jgi:hypothetical protein